MATERECFDSLKRRFEDVEFSVNVLPSKQQNKNNCVIDKNILKQMADDPKAVATCESGISLALELQKALGENGRKLVVLL